VSEFNSVDPAPANGERDVVSLRAFLLDPAQPMFERFRAIFSLRAVGTDEAALALGDAMIVDRSALLRHECAYVLGQMQREASISRLVQALRNDPNPMVRHEAAEALGAIGAEEVLPHLRAAVAGDAAIEVRESCQVALDHAAYLRNPTRL
jgi:deoxyhypusine monooxygenase